MSVSHFVPSGRVKLVVRLWVSEVVGSIRHDVSTTKMLVLYNDRENILSEPHFKGSVFYRISSIGGKY